MALHKKMRLILRELFNNSGLADDSKYDSEIAFWEKHLAKQDEFKDYLELVLDMSKRQQVFPEKLLPCLDDLKKNFPNEKLKLLEVGSGPTSNLVWGVDKGLFEVTAVDPLARPYNRLMKQNHYDYPIKPIEGTGEELLELFDQGTFHIAYSQNAIDHTESPQKCISNMSTVLKIGGILYISGHISEGTHMGWYGLHQHDLVPLGDGLLDIDRMGKSIDIIKGLGLIRVSCEKAGDAPGDWFTIIYKKVPNG
jgi:SAM-dependent methyltransferase